MAAPPQNLSSALPLPRTMVDALATVRDCVALTRPRVLGLVLFTAPAGLAIGHADWPGIWTLIGVVLGAALVGGGASAFNAWWEREADARMARTRDRPLPTGRLSPAQALGFAIAVCLAGVGVLQVSGGPLAAAIGAVAILHYVLIYTIWLKPRSPQNIVIGGAAGAAAPLIADAAADGRLGVWGVVLFAIIFLWTPPHFWAIALFRKAEYEAAGFPMMPSVVGNRRTRHKMLAYALILIPVTLLPWWGGELGLAYAVTALAGGGLFVTRIVQSMSAQNDEADRRVFRSSLVYLTLLFAVMLAELALR